MTLQGSGAIKASQVNTELGRTSTTAMSTNERVVRQLADKVTGLNATPSYSTALKYSDFYSQSRRRSATIGSLESANRNYGANFDNWVDASINGPQKWYLAKIFSNVAAGNYDSQSIDCRFTALNNYLSSDWNLVTLQYNINVNIFSASVNYATINLVPFYGSSMGNITAYGGQVSQQVTGTGTYTIDGTWNWDMASLMQSYSQVSVVFYFELPNGASIGEEIIGIDIGNSSMYVEADIA